MPVSSETDNLLRWDLKKRGIYEVYYIKLNDPLLGIALWLRFTVLVPYKGRGRPEAAVWGTFFDANGPVNNLAIKDVFHPNDCNFGREYVYLRFGGSEFFNNGTKGHIKRGHSSIEWDIYWRPQNASYRHYPDILYKTPFPTTKVLAPNNAMTAWGWLKVNGQQFSLDGVNAHQGHVWGSGYARGWTWLHSSSFLEDARAVVTLLSADVKGWLPSFTLISLKTSKGIFSFDRPRFWFRNKCDLHLLGGSFRAIGGDYMLKGECSTNKEDIVGLSYRDPNGSFRYCYNTEVADLKLEVYKKRDGGRHLFQTFTSNKSTAFETVKSEPNAVVPVWL